MYLFLIILPYFIQSYFYLQIIVNVLFIFTKFYLTNLSFFFFLFHLSLNRPCLDGWCIVLGIPPFMFKSPVCCLTCHLNTYVCPLGWHPRDHQCCCLMLLHTCTCFGMSAFHSFHAPQLSMSSFSSLPAVNAAVGSMITTPATTLAGATAAAASSDNLKGSAVMVGSQSLPPISMQQQLPQPYQNGSMVTTLPHTYTAAPSQSLHSMPTTVTYQPPAQPLL